MKPDLVKVMNGTFGTLLFEIGPKLGTDYSSGSVNLMGLLLLLGAEEHERAADTLFQDNRDLRALFGEAAGIVPDVGLRGRLAAAAAETDASLRISALTDANDGLKTLLVEVQAYLEDQAEPWAGPLEAKVWHVLRANLERRKVTFPSLG